MEIPRVDFAIIGGSGTLSSDFPKNFADVEILADNLFFDTPYGKSPAFRLCTVADKKFNELIHQVRPEDLMKYGIIPEIIGRLPVICTLETLDEDALLRILTEPKNAPVKQYEKLLAMDNVKLEFEEAALRQVAKMAIERKTGARSLKGIIEDVMLDVMFEIPKNSEPRRVVVTEACIKGEEEPKIFPLEENISEASA